MHTKIPIQFHYHSDEGRCFTVVVVLSSSYSILSWLSFSDSRMNLLVHYRFQIHLEGQFVGTKLCLQYGFWAQFVFFLINSSPVNSSRLVILQSVGSVSLLLFPLTGLCIRKSQFSFIIILMKVDALRWWWLWKSAMKWNRWISSQEI